MQTPMQILNHEERVMKKFVAIFIVVFVALNFGTAFAEGEGPVNQQLKALVESFSARTGMDERTTMTIIYLLYQVMGFNEKAKVEDATISRVFLAEAALRQRTVELLTSSHVVVVSGEQLLVEVSKEKAAGREYASPELAERLRVLGTAGLATLEGHTEILRNEAEIADAKAALCRTAQEEACGDILSNGIGGMEAAMKLFQEARPALVGFATFALMEEFRFK